MRRYMVFGGDHYYPCGGMHDYKESFDDRDEAREYANSLLVEKPVILSDGPVIGRDGEPYMRQECDWAHVYDAEEGTYA